MLTILHMISRLDVAKLVEIDGFSLDILEPFSNYQDIRCFELN